MGMPISSAASWSAPVAQPVQAKQSSAAVATDTDGDNDGSKAAQAAKVTASASPATEALRSSGTVGTRLNTSA